LHYGQKIGKLGEIAKALDVGIIDLLNEDKEENAIICPHCGIAL